MKKKFISVFMLGFLCSCSKGSFTSEINSFDDYSSSDDSISSLTSSSIESSFISSSSIESISSSEIISISSEEPIKTQEEIVHEKVKEYKAFSNNINEESVVLLGSNFEKLELNYLNISNKFNIVNFGIDASLINDWETYILDELVYSSNPKAVVLSLGINEINLGINENDVFNQIDSLITNLTKTLRKTRVILVENNPIKSGTTGNNKILNINNKYNSLVEKYDSVFGVIQNWDDYWQDISNGILKSNIYDANGINLNSNGYQILSDYINLNIDKFLTQPKVVDEDDGGGAVWGDII